MESPDGKSGKNDAKDKDIECYFCGKKGHRKADCYKRKAELENVKAEGRLSLLPRSVNAIEENNIPSSGSSQVTGLATLRITGNDVV